MAQTHVSNMGYSKDAVPSTGAIKRIGTGDVKAALRAGYKDFRAKPSHVIFLGLLYPVLCFVILLAATGENLLPLLYPLIAGFALIGPFAAIGLYEISRRRERGEDVHWRHAFGVFRSASFGQITVLGLLLLLLFSLWLLSALLIYDFTLGTIASEEQPLAGLFETAQGWTMILIGNAVGLVFALIVFATAVVSFPMLLDRHVDAPTAVGTSLRAVAKNPRPMAFWALIVVGGLVIGFIPFAVGLAVVFPILGHATWHLYRAVIA